MCRAVNERARLLLQFDGPLGLAKVAFPTGAEYPQPPVQKQGAGW